MDLAEAFVGDCGAYPVYKRVRNRFYAAFGRMDLEMEVLLSSCGFVENICGNFFILFFNGDV